MTPDELERRISTAFAARCPNAKADQECGARIGYMETRYNADDAEEFFALGFRAGRSAALEEAATICRDLAKEIDAREPWRAPTISAVKLRTAAFIIEEAVTRVRKERDG